MASPPLSTPSKSRHIGAPFKKAARWVHDRFSSSPPPSLSSTPTESQKPGLSPGIGNHSARLGPLVSDKSNDGSITTAESQEPSGSVQPVLSKDSALGPPVSNKGKDRLGVVWNGLQTALGVLKESSDAFPPLKSAVGGLVACLNVIQVRGCRLFLSNAPWLIYPSDSRGES